MITTSLRSQWQLLLCEIRIHLLAAFLLGLVQIHLPPPLRLLLLVLACPWLLRWLLKATLGSTTMRMLLCLTTMSSRQISTSRYL